ncbi:MAG: hypothetical protein ACE5GY_02725 [Thermodesulfobacteriota bacterium]
MRKHPIHIVPLLCLLVAWSMASGAMALDKESLDCLSCHDASIALDAGLMTVCNGPECTDHPIGVNYVRLASRNHGLKPAVFLDPNIKLVNNTKIGCTTCHVPYSAQNHTTLSTLRGLYPEPDPMLSVDSTASGLCLGCHYK